MISDSPVRTHIVSSRFIRIAGCCCVISSVTTLGLIFLPKFFPDAQDFDARARLILDPVYVARRWVALVHPLIVLVGALGVATVRFKEAAGSALAGFVFFLLWAGTEAVQQALTLVAVDWTWRPEYLAATSEAQRAALKGYIVGFEPLSDGLFFVLNIAFVCANICYVIAVWGRQSFQRVIAIAFGVGGFLGIVSLLTSFGGEVLPPAVMAVLYPLLQPAARFLTGIWLFNTARTAD
jgi:uncharacterized membrane protein